MRAAGDAYARAGAIALARVQWGNAGFAAIELVALAEAIELVSRSLYERDGRTLRPHHEMEAINLGRALICAGHLEEAVVLLEDCRRRLAPRTVERHLATAEMYLADAYARMGDRPRGRRLAADAAARLRPFRPLLAAAEALLASLLLEDGARAEALDHAGVAMAILEEVGSVEEREPLVRLVYARALDAVGRGDEARRVLADARDRLLARAARLSPTRRLALLEAIPENRDTLALAHRWDTEAPR